VKRARSAKSAGVILPACRSEAVFGDILRIACTALVALRQIVSALRTYCAWVSCVAVPETEGALALEVPPQAPSAGMSRTVPAAASHVRAIAVT
jgi:hypothetical protein